MYDSCAQRYAHRYEQFLNLCLVKVRLVFVCFKRLVSMFVFFCVSSDHSDFVLVFVFSVPSQEIGWEERLRNDLFCVKWDVFRWCLSNKVLLL